MQAPVVPGERSEPPSQKNIANIEIYLQLEKPQRGRQEHIKFERAIT